MIVLPLLLIVLWVAWWRLRPRRRLWVHPSLSGFGVCAEQLHDLKAPIINGHPGRNVARVEIDGRVMFLKREHCVSWLTRLYHLVQGFGPVSLSLREARVLEMVGDIAPSCLAWGEDDRGRAFLLIDGVNAVSLPEWLGQDHTSRERRLLAHQLGVLLARLHAKGLGHRDLYARHVLIKERGEITLIDWQRGGRRGTPLRDLATIHATLSESLAGRRERLVCLRAYLKEADRIGFTPSAGRRLVAQLGTMTDRLLQRRHVREKRHAVPASQAWISLDGDALCVTPRLLSLANGQSLDWLRLENQPLAANQDASRRWLSLGRQFGIEAGLALLMRHRQPLGWKPRTSAGHRLATLLLRLERHGIAAPVVLAVGQRTSTRRLESFVLIAPLSDTYKFATLLPFEPPDSRDALVFEAGRVLGRLHTACFYFDNHCPLFIQRMTRTIVIDDVKHLIAARRQRPGLAKRNLATLAEMVRRHGGDEALLHRGYAEAAS